jgi:predicted dehydrogenase
MQRRDFLTSAAAGMTLFPVAGRSLLAAEPAKKWRVGIIGHTGRGNYGHGLDTVWLSVPETEIVAIADADPAGLEVEKKKLKTSAETYADYKAMLQSARPELVAIGPRQVDQHLDMALAAIEAGARGLYMEKPFVRSPAEADQIAAACKKTGTKIAVAHRNRYHPTLVVVDKFLQEGGLGNVLEIRGRGKCDRRGGGEDLWVLGTHVLNLVAYLGGGLTSCSAILKQDGELVAKKHVKEGNEGLGPLAGNEVHARFETQRGPIAYFDSKADDGAKGRGFGLQVIGTEGIIDIKIDQHPLAQICRGNPFDVSVKDRKWLPISTAGVDVPEPRTDLKELVDRHVGPVRDLIDAVQNDREPLCGLIEATQTVEFVCATFESHRQGGARVALPLVERRNPLSLL